MNPTIHTADTALASCHNCHNGTFVTRSHDLRRVFGAQSYVQTVAVQACTQCGEATMPGPVSLDFDAAVTRHLVQFGTMEPTALVWLRKGAGLSTAALAELLDLAPAMVVAWESGAVAIDRTSRVLLGALAVEALDGVTTTRDRLLAAAAHHAAGVVRIHAA